VMAIIVSMGLIPLLGWKIHTVTILLPVILLAVANNYGIHLLARYQEDNLPGVDITPRELASRGIDALAYPTLACGITTMIGMLALVTHIIIPAKQLGVLSAVGIGFAIAGSLLFIPAVLSVLPRAKPVLGATPQPDHKTSKFFLDRLLAFFAHWVTHRPRAILIGAVVFTAIVGIGATRVVVDTNPMSFYAKSAPIWRSTQLLNEHLGGWAGISVVVEGDIKDPKVLHGIDDLEQHLKKNPLVGTTTSIADVVRKINVVLHDGDPKYDKIPDSRRAIAQYLLLYSMSGNPKDLEKLVDFSYEHAQIMAKITDSGTRAATEVTDYTKAYISEHSNGVHYLVGGLLVLMADMVHHIVWGQIASMAIAGVLVGLLVTVFFRSPVAGLLGVFPLTLALTMIFGVMGFCGIELNMVTALLSSIMIGVGIDYTIHFMWRYRDERRAGLGAEAAIERTLTTTGRGIIFNAFSVVVGFVVLVISAFFPVRFFGLLVAISILGSLVGALVVLPAIVMVVRPKVLEPKPPKPAVQE
jgi:hydrophobe/amphiphile efflux-3 (HAE3) family protein